MLNIVKQETQQESCDSPKVKEEPDDTPSTCAEESTPASTDIKTEPDESVQMNWGIVLLFFFYRRAAVFTLEGKYFLYEIKMFNWGRASTIWL